MSYVEGFFATQHRTAIAIACVLALSGCGARQAIPSLSENAAGRNASAAAVISRSHVLTWDYLGGYAGTHRITWQQAAPWLSYAVTDAPDASAIRAAGIKTVFYTDPNRQAPSDPEYSSDETTFAHDCSGNRIYSTLHPTMALMDPASNHLWSLWSDQVTAALARSSGNFDAIFDDEADEVLQTTALPCAFDQTEWTSASNAMITSLTYPVVYNGLWAFKRKGTSWGISDVIGLNKTSIGGDLEGCYSEAPPPADGERPHGGKWVATEDTEITMARHDRLFLCKGSNPTGAGESLAERMYMVASFLLTYDPRTSILSERFQTPTQFHVDPEAAVVPTQPLVAEPLTIAALRTPYGLYEREYGACYVFGVNAGPCIVVVNSDDTTVLERFDKVAQYTRTLEISGSGILDGGSLATSGPAPREYLGGERGFIAFR